MTEKRQAGDAVPAHGVVVEASEVVAGLAGRRAGARRWSQSRSVGEHVPAPVTVPVPTESGSWRALRVERWPARHGDVVLLHGGAGRRKVTAAVSADDAGELLQVLEAGGAVDVRLAAEWRVVGERAMWVRLTARDAAAAVEVTMGDPDTYPRPRLARLWVDRSRLRQALATALASPEWLTYMDYVAATAWIEAEALRIPTLWPGAYRWLQVVANVLEFDEDVVLCAERNGVSVGVEVAWTRVQRLRDALAAAGPVKVAVGGALHGMEARDDVWVVLTSGGAKDVRLAVSLRSRPNVPAVLHCGLDRRQLLAALETVLDHLAAKLPPEDLDPDAEDGT